MLTNVSFLSCYSPFSLISIESSVEVQFSNEHNESKVKNIKIKFYFVIHSLLHLNYMDLFLHILLEQHL